MKITFYGAAREVTGSKHLLETDNGKKILLDCGEFQGKGLETRDLNKALPFDPPSIDHIILTHAHIDHSGLIPYMYHNGFTGSVICTNATRDLCSIMLADSGKIQEHDTLTFNKKRAKKGLPPVEPLYTQADAVACMSLFISVGYDRKLRVDESISVKFTNTGHMLGSAVASIEVRTANGVKKIAYTGDIGRPGNRILKSPEPFPQADILITESTYGDRLHPTYVESDEELFNVVQDTCVRKKGKLIIPAFSVGRTQEIVYALNNLYNQGRLPKVDTYVDSPLSVNATNIFRLHTECFNKNIKDVMLTDPDPFGYNSLFYITSKEDSMKLNDIKQPVIIISASGMMEAGRVKHHLANSISNPNNTVLIVGYCAPTTLGARIGRGDKKVSIHGVEYAVNADIRKIEAFSGHGDYKEMSDYLMCQDPSLLEKVIIVHGEYSTQLAYSKHLESKGFKNIFIPDKGETIEL
ncbi:MAG TPA: MBL fold metallo-hydrolase [Bacteroidales bacterium]|nr:MBL fold metallo-hydrolase [Bacteroidales bacterium]HPT11306.1 MBL fold metallo-hydrolase [Bacteroidales bacterium]